MSIEQAGNGDIRKTGSGNGEYDALLMRISQAYEAGHRQALSQDLTVRHGRGFSRSNLTRMRQFYLVYQKCAKPPHILSWSHFLLRQFQ